MEQPRSLMLALTSMFRTRVTIGLRTSEGMYTEYAILGAVIKKMWAADGKQEINLEWPRSGIVYQLS